jgi:Ni2+-binding GTPase involved in maturation of urease and hydrogenase
MVGGFLGAGKTTAMGRLAKHFSDQGLRVGLITNDQAGGLVDTALMQAQGFATQEIAGGCFCCRFQSLVQAAASLNDQTKPDVFIAEPVGSCTDLVATVSYPLRRIYGDRFSVAPYSVLVDPLRARRVLGLDAGAGFSAKVTYIYRKQLEEADLILINKSDLLDAASLAELQAALQREFAQAEVLVISARQQEGLQPWFSRLDAETQGGRAVMPVDYEVYAQGEALLGWLNATLKVSAKDEFESEDLLLPLAAAVQQRLQAQGIEIAHLKMTLSPDDALAGELASVNLVRSDQGPEMGMTLDEPCSGGQLIVNLRAEGAPEILLEALHSAVAGCDAAQLDLEHEEHFRPGKPVPTHRDEQAPLHS